MQDSKRTLPVLLLEYKLTAGGVSRIKTRLRDAGWSKELDAMDDCSFQRLRELPAVRRPTELTDRGTCFLLYISVSSFLTLGQRGTACETTWSAMCRPAVTNS